MQVAIAASASTEAKKCRYVRINATPIAWRGDRLVIGGTINSRPVPMIIDTGATNTMVPGSLMKELNLPLVPALEGESWGGGGVSKMGAVRTSEMTVGNVTGHGLIMRVDLDSRMGTVLVGDDFLFQQDLEINDHEMVLFKPLDCGDRVLSYWDPLAPFATMEDMDKSDPWPIVQVSIDGSHLRALVDTGAPTSMLDLAAARKLGVDPAARGVKPLVGHGVGTHDMEIFPPQAFAEFEIGGEKVSHPRIAVADIFSNARKDMWFLGWFRLRNAPDMVLGADFLRAHRVLFSPGQHRMYLSYGGGPIFNAPTVSDLPPATPAVAAKTPHWQTYQTQSGYVLQVDTSTFQPFGAGGVQFSRRMHLASHPADGWVEFSTQGLMDCAKRQSGSMLPNGTPSLTPVTEPAADLDEICRLAGIPTTMGARPDWQSVPDHRFIDTKSVKIRDGLLFFSYGRGGRDGIQRADLDAVVDCATRQRSGVVGERYTLQPLAEGGEQARLAEAACRLANLPMPPAPGVAPVDFGAVIAPEQAGDENLSHDIDRATLAERDGLVRFRYATRLLADGRQAQEDQWVDAVVDCGGRRRSDVNGGRFDLVPVGAGTRGALQVARACALASQAGQH